MTDVSEFKDEIARRMLLNDLTNARIAGTNAAFETRCVRTKPVEFTLQHRRACNPAFVRDARNAPPPAVFLNEMGRTIIVAQALLFVLVLAQASAAGAQRNAPEFPVDSLATFSKLRHAVPDSGLSIEPPQLLFANKRLGSGQLDSILQEYDPERSAVKLYGYYTLRHPKGGKTQQRIRVPYYAFQGGLTTYALDSVLVRGDTVTLRFDIPAPQGHSYEISLDWKARRIIAVRYEGQGSAGTFTMCLDYAGRPLGTTIALNHIRPTGRCYEMYDGFEGSHFIGRGVSPANRKELIVTDGKFRLLRSYQLRYKISSLVSGDEFFVIFDDARLKEAAEAPVKVVSGNRRYWR